MSKKHITEDCLTLSIFDINRLGYMNGTAGSSIYMWYLRYGKAAKVDLTVFPFNSAIHLGYIIDGQDIDCRIELSSTSCNFGGQRYWFKCPSCGRRVANMYMPYGAKYFACRNCYDLSYRSRQRPALHRRLKWMGFYGASSYLNSGKYGAVISNIQS